MRTALVTGGTRGIGRAIVEVLLEQEIKVISTYNRSSKIADEMIAQYGKDKIEFYQFEQGSRNSHQELFSKINSPLDILINNAGLGSKTVESVSKNKYEQDEALLRVNTLGPLWLCEEFIKRADNEKSTKIINISSVGGGIFHFPGFRIADGMSKAAVTFMTKQMAAENVHTKVDIFAICPGATDTDMFNASTLASLDQEQRDEFIGSLAKKRLIDPKEIANLCSFLISEQSQILHGAILDSSLGLGVNPGILMK